MNGTEWNWIIVVPVNHLLTSSNCPRFKWSRNSSALPPSLTVTNFSKYHPKIPKITYFCLNMICTKHIYSRQKVYSPLSNQLQSNLVIRNGLIRNKLALRNHLPWPNANLLLKDKELVALRNHSMVTIKFLFTKFDCIWIKP